VWLVTCGGLDAVVTVAVGDSLDFGTVVVIVIASSAVSVATVPDEVESVVVVVVVVGVFLKIAILFFFNKSLNSFFSLVADSSRVFNR